MLFNSFVFIFLFLPITLFIYFILNKFRLIKLATIFLTLASLFFYGYWNFIHIPLILSSVTFNFFCGNYLCKASKFKKPLLSFGILANIVLLGYYKYTDFFIENFNGIFGSNIPIYHIILPLGISFFTFTQIAFLVDCFKGKVKETDYIKYALFVTYFPHLLAGPIIHHSEMMPQFANLRLKFLNSKNFNIGILLFSIGLFKKVVIADFFAHFATYGFDVSNALSMGEAWITSLSYTFQLYFDFSGYTDMAIGVSYMFNIVLPLNFNSPYKALDVQDFWRRWHITLSRFLRDYIYIPLGGNKISTNRTYINVLIVFIVGGFWHGAGWTFIIWGALHGISQVVFRFYHLHFKPLNKYISWLITFNFINITWVYFRAKDLESAFKVLKGMFDIRNFKLSGEFVTFINSTFGIINELERTNPAYLCMLGIFSSALIISVAFKNSNQIAQKSNFSYLTSIFIAVLLLAAFLATRTAGVTQFLYFNF